MYNSCNLKTGFLQGNLNTLEDTDCIMNVDRMTFPK